ncbi:MAG: PEP-CTERM sorting domain-containing protein [Vitreoscilla sp.]
MRQAAFAAALAAALVHAGAQGATYVATLSGSGTHQTQTDTPITWTGQVTVVTDGTADGTYTGATLESITVDTDVFDWSFTKGQTQVLTEPLPGVFLLVGPEPGTSVSLAGGRLSGIDLVYDDESNIDTMSGLTVSAVSQCRTGACHGVPDNYMVSGTLTPLAGTVPEPPAPWMLLAGLGLAATGLRRRDA